MPRRFDEPSYRRLFAVVEAKGGSTPADQTDAFEQLILYSKNMYAVQHNRRLLWGITACGAVVKACLFGPNFMLASTEMDLGSEEGRSELVRLIVYWSFCELDKLGYDPSVRFNREHGCMEIDVAPPGNGDGTGKQTFYSCEVITVAERVFGRHTRCFIAHRDPASAIERVKVAKSGIIIKDAWPEAAEHAKDDDRDEARYLRKIHEELPGDRYDGMYPEFLEGGRVHLGNEDTTQQQLNEHAEREGEQMALRVHKRIAMKGIGKPLKTISSCLELIIVVADVMSCHSGIVEHCNILHRDISTANILARDTADGIGGMLIDFDMAVDVDRKGNAVRTERTGTYPFMSVGNLEGSPHNRTALDDWESLLYILCWLGTYGWNTATSRTDIGDLHIKKWEEGSMENIAYEKRQHLDSARHFAIIPDEFNRDIPGIGPLQRLVKVLRKILIDEHKDDDLKGALLKDPEDDVDLNDDVFLKPSPEPKVVIDPFKNRAEKWKEISQSLLGVLNMAAKSAKRILSESRSNQLQKTI
ncbi:hypothetical protein BX667DRAFT_497731 [Coemansia mojavensis]|nr:hypothetical protein BX667DRAFT_497731 [Coemansia mojavensis]